MQLIPTISTLVTNHGRRSVDIWADGDALILEVYLPPEEGVQSRAELKVILEPGELFSAGEGRFVYETAKKAVVLQYQVNRRRNADEALQLVKYQLKALESFANLEPSPKHTYAQIKAEFASNSEALFAFIAQMVARRLSTR